MNQISLNGELYDFPMRGPSGPDGSPIGTIISFLGTRAPNDYLICDGSEYSVNDYPDLANFFEDQFQSKYYFGGSGDKFHVPDMRNLFLRGYHGSSEDQLSGEIGVEQEGTTHPGIFSTRSTDSNPILHIQDMNDTSLLNMPTKCDTMVRAIRNGSIRTTSPVTLTSDDIRPFTYTSRPVNMAILYCIKAISSTPILEEYDTEVEDCQWHVRKWSDGYCELIGKKYYSKIACSAPYGDIRLSTQIGNYNIPLILIEKYSEQFSLVDSDVGAILLFGYKNDNPEPLKRTNSCVVIRPDTLTVSGYITVTIIGRWK